MDCIVFKDLFVLMSEPAARCVYEKRCLNESTIGYYHR